MPLGINESISQVGSRFISNGGPAAIIGVRAQCGRGRSRLLHLVLVIKSRKIRDEIFEALRFVSLATPDCTSLTDRLSKLMCSAQTFDLLQFQMSEDLFERFEVETEFSGCEPRHHATSKRQAVAEAVASVDRPSSPVPDVPLN